MSRKNKENSLNNVSNSTIYIIDREKINKVISENKKNNDDEYKLFCNKYIATEFSTHKIEDLKKIYDIGNGLLNQYFIAGNTICDSEIIIQLQHINSKILYQINIKQAYYANEQNKQLSKKLRKNIDYVEQLKRELKKQTEETKYIKNDIKSIITTIISIILTISIIPTAIVGIGTIDPNYILPFISSIIFFGMIMIIFVYSIYQNKIKASTKVIVVTLLLISIIFWVLSFNVNIKKIFFTKEENIIETINE